MVGQNILEPQAWWNAERHGSADDGLRVLTLAVNDARRKQLYFELCQPASPDDAAHDARPLIAMDIDYPANIVERVNDAVAAYERRFDGRVVVDVVGHGAAKYSDALASIQARMVSAFSLDGMTPVISLGVSLLSSLCICVAPMPKCRTR